MSLLQIIFKFFYIKHLLPDVFHNYYMINYSVHDHQTRNKSCLHLSAVNSNFGKRCSTFRAGQLWNDLPKNFKVMCAFSLFKKNIKQFLLFR